MNFYEKEKLSALDAKFEAQKIAFAPFVFQASKALRDLKILTVIEENPKGINFEQITTKLPHLKPYGIRVLIEAGLGIGLILWSDNLYKLTKTGSFILNDPMTIANMDFVHDVNYLGFYNLKESIENSKPEGLKVFGKQWDTVYQALSSLPNNAQESWFKFDHFYSDTSFDKVLPIVFAHKPKRILDIGGNTGKWSFSCVNYDNEVTVTIADLPQQTEMAQKNIIQNKLQDRILLHPLNILKEDSSLPHGNDIIWMSQFLDCFSEEQIVAILLKVKAVMNTNTIVFIMETFWDRQKYEAAAFSLQQTSLYFTCIANGNSQMYQSDIFIKCVEKAGLKIIEQKDGIGISHTLLTCKLA